MPGDDVQRKEGRAIIFSSILESQTENYIGLSMDIPRLNEESENYE